MKSHRYWWIVRKDLREIVTNRMVLLPMAIVPVIICVALSVAIRAYPLRFPELHHDAVLPHSW